MFLVGVLPPKEEYGTMVNADSKMKWGIKKKLTSRP
jgi:hypothetical protein